MTTIGIIGALPDEVAQVAAVLDSPRKEQYAGVDYYLGVYGGKRLVVCCAGMGKANAAGTTQVLVTRYGAEGIIFSGIAGNTSEKIGVGDVVVGKTVVYHDFEPVRMLNQSAPYTDGEYECDPLLCKAALAACQRVGVRHILGRIATGDQFIGDPETKARIVAAVQPDCVEMEGAAVGQTAMRNGVPFVVLRAMSDNSDKSAEELGGAAFDITEYVTTASRIVVELLHELGAKIP